MTIFFLFNKENRVVYIPVPGGFSINCFRFIYESNNTFNWKAFNLGFLLNDGFTVFC